MILGTHSSLHLWGLQCQWVLFTCILCELNRSKRPNIYFHSFTVESPGSPLPERRQHWSSKETLHSKLHNKGQLYMTLKVSKSVISFKHVTVAYCRSFLSSISSHTVWYYSSNTHISARWFYFIMKWRETNGCLINSCNVIIQLMYFLN